MQNDSLAKRAAEAPGLDDDTRHLVRRATAQFVNAAITRRLAGAAREEARRDQIEQRVWRAAIVVIVVAVALMTVYVFERSALG